MIHLDLKQLDPTRIDLKQLDPTRIDLTRFDLTRFDLPRFDLPRFDVSRVAGLARDAAYVGVGALVVATQTADERRRALAGQVTTRVRRLVASR